MQDGNTFVLYAVIPHQFRMEWFVCSQMRPALIKLLSSFFPSVFLSSIPLILLGELKMGLGGKCVA